ncbi:MAG: PP2C family protein-serine/threonine phosphatase, partial [Vicinamibacterales bacterium]|nr:PP2C family protein-serine/threonine phosphatase [Vicinamibacterales bacterium]
VYFTLLYARFNRRTRRLTVVNAGHPPAVVVPASGDPVPVSQDGDVVGAFPDAVFGQTSVDTRPGDRLVMFTDGVIEGAGDRAAGIDRLLRACADTRQLPLADMVEQVTTLMLAGLEATDDIILLGAEW